MTNRTETQPLKILTDLKETLRIIWADGQSDCIHAQYSLILGRQVPFFLAGAQRRRRQAGRTDQIKQVLVGQNLNFCSREWDVQEKKWCDLREVACHDCGQPMRHKMSDRMGEVFDWRTGGFSLQRLYLRTEFERHTCTPRQSPVEGTSYTATYCARAAIPGLIGGYSIEWRDSLGKLLGGLMSSRLDCERQLRIWGFSGPINWKSK